MIGIKKLLIAAVTAVCLAFSALFFGCGGKASHKAYAQRVNSPQASERRAAMEELRVRPFDEKMVPVILQATRDKDTQVRIYAFYALGKADPRVDGVITAVIAGINDTLPDVRRAVVSTINELNPFPSAIIPYMIRMLTDPDEGVRRHITLAFVGLEGTGVASMMRHIDSKDENMRMAVIRVLAEIGPPAKGSLLRLKKIAAEDENEEIKKAAGEAVRRIER